jgi:8-oxo-dGTP pyrophosphatase MutT (NUDIX family)
VTSHAPDGSAITDVPIRPAATVVLLRDADSLQVWLQQRATTLVFAAGMHAFPGGAVDDDDAAPITEAIRRQAVVWRHAERWAASVAAAACRETWEEAGVRLMPDELVPWARWVTPIGSPRRFDAHFFLARLPAGAQPQALTGEVAAGAWLGVIDAVVRHHAGALPMWPPTLTTLEQLAPLATVTDALAAAPSGIEAVLA